MSGLVVMVRMINMLNFVDHGQEMRRVKTEKKALKMCVLPHVKSREAAEENCL